MYFFEHNLSKPKYNGVGGGVLRHKRHIPRKTLSYYPQPGQDTHSKFPPPGEITYLDLPSPTPPSSHTMFPLPAFAAYTQRHIPRKTLSYYPQPGQDTHSKFPPPGEITYLDLPSPTPPSSHTMFPLPAFAEKAKQQQMSLSAGTADNDAITAYLTIENTPLS